MNAHSIGKTLLAMTALGAVVGHVAFAGATITSILPPAGSLTIQPVVAPPPYVRRIPASACQNYQLGTDVYTNTQFAQSNWGRDVAPVGHQQDMICPIPSDSTLSHAQLGSLKIYGRDNNPANMDSTRLCVTFTTTEGGECGWASIYSGWPYNGTPNSGGPFMGDYAITYVAGGQPGMNVYGGDTSLDPFVKHPNDMPYVYIQIAAGDTFRGIVVSQ